MCGTPNELKRLPEVTPEGTTRLEVRCPKPADAMRRLNQFEYVRDATIFGDALHVLAEQGREDRLVQDLASFGFSDPAVRAIPPTLEDVFVTLTRREEKLRHV